MNQTKTYLIDGILYTVNLAEPKRPPGWIHFEEEVVGKNKPCPCGSGKKFKLCCMQKGGIK